MSKKEIILLSLGIFITLIRCVGGGLSLSYTLIAWGLHTMGDLWCLPGRKQNPFTLGFLFLLTAAALGAAGGAVKEILKQVVGFAPTRAATPLVPGLLFLTLLLWEGGGRRYLINRTASPAARGGEILLLVGGLSSFFLLIAGLFLAPPWRVGDSAAGAILCLLLLIRLLPRLISETSGIFASDSSD